MKIKGWGCYPVINATGYNYTSEEKLKELLKKDKKYIVHANGRSYGDSSLNDYVFLTDRLNNILDFDDKKGIVTCESGVLLSDIIGIFLPKGWFLSVTPGTKFITVGGAIASDVHGKNHHTDGCFSEFVISFDLMLSDGNIVICSREENRELFNSTCGGMGLTGIILNVRFKLKKVNSGFIHETIIRCRNLREVFSNYRKYKDVTYSVAWIDCTAKGDDIGRSVLMTGEHAKEGKMIIPPVRPSFSVPFNMPKFCLNKFSIKIFNIIYFYKNTEFKENRLTSINTFFYPLDTIDNWNRMYGKNGFTQYQLILPLESSLEGLKIILSKVSGSGLGTFLTILKLFGRENENYLSFPLSGYTLTLDLKIQPKLFPFLNELDKIIMEYGGRLYLTKDVRMGKEIFEKGYQKLDQFKEIREKYHLTEKFNSLQSKRLGI